MTLRYACRVAFSPFLPLAPPNRFQTSSHYTLNLLHLGATRAGHIWQIFQLLFTLVFSSLRLINVSAAFLSTMILNVWQGKEYPRRRFFKKKKKKPKKQTKMDSRSWKSREQKEKRLKSQRASERFEIRDLFQTAGRNRFTLNPFFHHRQGVKCL